MKSNPYFSVESIEDSIYYLKITKIDPSDSQFDEYIEVVEEIFCTKKGAIIFDVSDATFLSSEKRIKAGKLIKECSEKILENHRGVAYVMKSMIPNIILKGILLINPYPVPYKVFKEREEAVQWIHEIMSPVLK